MGSNTLQIVLSMVGMTIGNYCVLRNILLSEVNADGIKSSQKNS